MTLAGGPGASINDPTPTVADDNNVIDIVNSRNILVKDLTVNGGLNGILCAFFSHCHLSNVTVQGAVEGVGYARSTGNLTDNTTIQNNVFGGMSVIRNSHLRIVGLTVQTNGNPTDGAYGIFVDDNGHVDLFLSTIQDHDDGDGIIIGTGSHVGLFGTTVTGNGGAGVSVGPSSVLRVRGGLGQNVITGNGGDGIRLDHLTFLSVAGPRNITGNGGLDVNCTVSTAKTRGTGGSASPNLLVPGTPPNGTTNCTEPAP